MTGTLEHLDPTTLVIGENVRDDAALDPHFLASVAEHGVLQPLTAVRTEAGVEVRDGQRRTLAAREAKLLAIPVYVLDAQLTDDKAATAERIAQQIVTNDQRAALTDAQRAKGIHQMLLAGVSAAKVAKKLAVDRDTVTAAATVADSPAANGPAMRWPSGAPCDRLGDRRSCYLPALVAAQRRSCNQPAR